MTWMSIPLNVASTAKARIAPMASRVMLAPMPMASSRVVRPVRSRVDA